MIDKSIISLVSEPMYFEIEKGAIRKFAEAIGDDNPIYHDERKAKEKGYSSLVAPLSFPTTFRGTDDPDWYRKLDRQKLLHAEQEYRYDRRICAGETIKCIDKVVDVIEKKGSKGNMYFIVREREGYDIQNHRVFLEKLTLVTWE